MAGEGTARIDGRGNLTTGESIAKDISSYTGVGTAVDLYETTVLKPVSDVIDKTRENGVRGTFNDESPIGHHLNNRMKLINEWDKY